MNSRQGTMDLTTGSPVKQILLFSLPLILGTLFQQLYSFVDTVMVGRLIGTDALASVGATYSLHFLILGFVQGTCVGFGIPLAQAFGAKEREEYQRFFWNGSFICAVMAVILTVSMTVLTDGLLNLMNTPSDILAGASVYVKIIFLGIPASILYNFCAGALRAAGDSSHPFYFLLFTSLLNMILDYLFIVPLHMGVAGAAFATVLSQLLSGLLNLYWLIQKTDLLKDCGKTRKVSVFHIKRLSIVGFPMGFEYSISALGAVVMQGAINRLGSTAVAGQTAGEKIRQMFTLPMESVGMGMATYVGQNDGADRPDRIRDGIRAGLLIQWIYCAVVWAVIFVGKGFFTSLVLGTRTGETAELCIQYLTIISTLFAVHGALMIMRNTLQGMGYSAHAVLSGAGELIGRSIGAYLAVDFFGFAGICFANPMAWFLALLYCTQMVIWYLKKRLQTRKESVHVK